MFSILSAAHQDYLLFSYHKGSDRRHRNTYPHILLEFVALGPHQASSFAF